jgi:hypothetical protein
MLYLNISHMTLIYHVFHANIGFYVMEHLTFYGVDLSFVTVVTVAIISWNNSSYEGRERHYHY